MGSSFTNPSITTDFAEALVEIVTPVFTNVDDLYNHLLGLHVFINKSLDNELLWPFSIPPRIKSESKINIATYANNKAGNLKSVSYTHLRAHETKANLVCRLLLEKKKKNKTHTLHHRANPTRQT